MNSVIEHQTDVGSPKNVIVCESFSELEGPSPTSLHWMDALRYPINFDHPEFLGGLASRVLPK